MSLSLIRQDVPFVLYTLFYTVYKAYELVNLIPISILNPKISDDNHRPTCYLNIVNDSGLVCFRSWRFKVIGVSTIINIIRCSMRETRETGAKSMGAKSMGAKSNLHRQLHQFMHIHIFNKVAVE